jgi:hypothetical protein
MITETHLNDIKINELNNNLLLINSGPAPGQIALKGVGFIISKNVLADDKYLFHGYSERVARLSLRDSSNITNLIVAYAPTEASTATGNTVELDRFYCDLESALKDCGNEKVIIGGDFNCRIGADPETMRCVVGKWCGLFTSENGERLVDFCHEYGLRVENTFFRHRLNQRTSWTHAATGRRELLDLFLARGDIFEDVRTYINFDCGSS